MSRPVAAIANEFLSLGIDSKCSLTPMQLLKLVYISHGWHLAVTGGPLFDGEIQAWKYGPVVPSLYHEMKRFGNGPILELAHDSEAVQGSVSEFTIDAPSLADDDDDTKRLIRWVWSQYGHLTGRQLSDLTHKPGTPWSQAREQMKVDNRNEGIDPETWRLGYPIRNQDIRKHYLDLWKQRNGSKLSG